MKFCFHPFQAVGKPLSLTPSQRQGWPTPSQRRAARATWASVAATGRSRAITTRRKAGSGEDALPTSSTESSSPAASWTPARSKRPQGASWTYITMRQEERYKTFFQYHLQYTKYVMIMWVCMLWKFQRAFVSVSEREREREVHRRDDVMLTNGSN